MKDYVYDQKCIYNGKYSIKIEDMIMSKQQKAKNFEGLMTLLRSVGFATYSNYLIEFKEKPPS